MSEKKHNGGYKINIIEKKHSEQENTAIVKKLIGVLYPNPVIFTETKGSKA